MKLKITFQDGTQKTYKDKQFTEKTIQLTINLSMDFPDSWTNDDIEFYLNESSYCLSNIIDELDRYDKTVGCLCDICTAKVLE